MNRIFHVVVAVAALLVFAACGPGDRRSGSLPLPRTDAGASSGLAAGRLVSSLSSAEARTLCEYVVAVSGSTPASCDGGFSFDPISVDECTVSINAPPAGCTVTVGNVEACFRTVGTSPCTAFGSAACAPVLACGR